MKYGNTTVGGMSFGSTRIGGAKFGNTIVFQPGGGLPDGPVDWIATDGNAYINTGIISTFPLACDFKAVFYGGAGEGVMLGSRVANSGARAQLAIPYSSRMDFGAGTAYYSGVDISDSYANETAVFVKALIIRASGQSFVSAKQAGETDYTKKTISSYPAATGTSLPLFLFAQNYGGTANNLQPSGTRLYYCKIYRDSTFSTAVFDGTPYRYRGKYGLWDSVSDSFFGNAASSGAFIGPSTI